MRQWILIGILLWSAMALTDAQDLDQAAIAYVQGNYAEAIQIYEGALANGQANGVLYLNLAHAYFAQGNRGQAMLNYQRAAHYLPRVHEIEQQIIRLRTANGILAPTNSDWLETLANSSSALTLQELSRVSLALWSLLFGLLALRRLLRRGDIVFNSLLLITAIGLLTATILLGSRAHIQSERPSAVLVSDGVMVMSGPDATYLELGRFAGGLELHVLEERNGWVRVTTLDRRQGWIEEATIAYVVVEARP